MRLKIIIIIISIATHYLYIYHLLTKFNRNNIIG